MADPSSIGAGKPPMVLEYVFTEGTASPFDVMYDPVHPVPATPVSISTSESPSAVGYNNGRKLVRTSDGTLYAVYFKRLAGQYQIYVKRSTDDGATWTDETRISTAAGMESHIQEQVSIAVDSADNLHVVWKGRTTAATGYQIWYTKYDGSWSAPLRISTAVNMATYHHYIPSIAVDGDDHLHVVWDGNSTAVPTARAIWYAKYDGSWSTPLHLSTLAGMTLYPQWYPCITADSLNHLHVTWDGRCTGITSKSNIWYVKYDGSSWSDPLRISTKTNMATNYQHHACIAVDSQDHLHVVWDGRHTDYPYIEQIWYAKYDGAWSDPIRISDAGGMGGYKQYLPSIAVDGDDHLHVIWYGMATDYTDYNKVWYATYETSWSTPAVLQPTGQNLLPNLRWSRWP